MTASSASWCKYRWTRVEQCPPMHASSIVVMERIITVLLLFSIISYHSQRRMMDGAKFKTHIFPF
eukprot:scaffold13838_cov104-Skeletonema_dohrnii-CCMP3373.AAC.8